MIAIFWLLRSLKKYSDVEALTRDVEILGDIKKVYQNAAEKLEALKADEEAVLAKMEAGDLEGATELFDAVMKAHSKA